MLALIGDQSPFRKEKADSSRMQFNIKRLAVPAIAIESILLFVGLPLLDDFYNTNTWSLLPMQAATAKAKNTKRKN